MQVYAFATAQEAMMAAYRERLQREALYREVEARRGRPADARRRPRIVTL
jgi:hypothetical protein